MVTPVNGSNHPSAPKSSKIVEAVRMGKIAGEAEVIGSHTLTEQTKITDTFKPTKFVAVKQFNTAELTSTPSKSHAFAITALIKPFRTES